MQLKECIKIYNNLNAADQKSLLKKIIANKDETALLKETNGELARPATRMLADMGTKIKEIAISHSQQIISLLKSNDPKIRINAASIIKNTDPEFYLDDLITAADNEDTMFVLPAYIKAIGAAKNEKAKEYIDNYKIKSTVEKHKFEEKKALNSVKVNFIKRSKVNLRVSPNDIVLFTSSNLNVVKNDLSTIGVKTKKTGKFLAASGIKSFSDLYKVRSFSDAYIYLGWAETEKIPELIKAREKAIIQRTGVTNYRLEVKGVSHKERIELIEKSKGLNSLLVNTPSAYSIELLALVEGDKARLLLNPLTDTRFNYRKESVPASITGANAAAVCSFASEYFKPNARVLDNFCGSGTMLFERGFYPHSSLTGVDINSNAIKAAEANSRHANAHPKFIHMDALKFTAKKYDEIITNMPFGLRVGSHNQNEKLYKRYIFILTSILTDGGLAVLYTHDKRLFEKILKTQPQLNILKKENFEAGGLNPAAFIIQKTV